MISIVISGECECECERQTCCIRIQLDVRKTDNLFETLFIVIIICIIWKPDKCAPQQSDSTSVAFNAM